MNLLLIYLIIEQYNGPPAAGGIKTDARQFI